MQTPVPYEEAMDQSTIFAPFFAMILLTLVVWTYMYARRIPFIRRSNLSPEQLTPIELARISPAAVSNPSDNLKNLFEIPTLFYGLALYLLCHPSGGHDLSAGIVDIRGVPCVAQCSTLHDQRRHPQVLALLHLHDGSVVHGRSRRDPIARLTRQGRRPHSARKIIRMADYRHALDALYTAPLGDFIAERKRLAAELRAAGEQDAANQLGRRRRPTTSAWTVNQLYRHARDAFDALLAAARGIRKGDLGETRPYRQALAELRKRAA